MTLAAGTRLGPYVIESLLGAGGMGEVYKARDSRLDRAVALKLLRPGVAATPEAKARLEREARAISQLQHPHICTLFDVGQDKGIDFLVMEYLEGETLAARLAQGALPLPEFYRIGGAIATALEQAHRAGIIHRDLKPGNVMLTRGGVKLLDFGLAKPAAMAAAPATASLSLAEAATLTSPSPMDAPLTRQGALVGTVQYMSPEQIQGTAADARSDIFALGVVLYEMATGQRPFSGKTQLRVASSILEDEPAPPSQFRPELPRGLDHLISGCLAKDPEARYADVHDVALELAWLAAAPIQTARHEQRALPLWAWAGFAAALAAGIGAGFLLRHPRADASFEATLLPPYQTSFDPNGFGSGPVLSPDGSRIAFVAGDGSSSRLYVRALDSLAAQPLAGTEGADEPFWSPDSRSLGFFAHGEMERVDASGGPIQVLAPATSPRGGSWGQAGVIVFAPTITSPLMWIPAAGGSPLPATRLASGARSNRWPFFLPDGKHFLFLSIPGQVCIGTLGSDRFSVLLNNSSNATYADGNLLYVSGSSLLAQPFDLRTLATSAGPVPIADNAAVQPNDEHGDFSASANGQLVYLAVRARIADALQWFSSAGKSISSVPGDVLYAFPAISPDGAQLAVSIDSGSHPDIWILDLKRNTRVRLTVSPIGSGTTGPVWTPNGRNIIYTQFGTGVGYAIYMKAADGSGAAHLLAEGGGYSKSLSTKGNILSFQQGTDIWALPLTAGAKPFPVLRCSPGCADPALSPNGKWLAYVSSGQVYITSFPKPRSRWPVSTQGGDWPQWAPDGHTLFYEQGFRSIDSVAVTASEIGLTLGAVQTLFPINLAGIADPFVTSDGKRFLVVTRSANNPSQLAAMPPQFTLITNWPTRLKH